ncbi:hypothetical protein [Mycobacteroides abscessus]|uniref:hypothetical protein n=1 Tax=Mycobacteroides abscessus TaxID=36809 RepID=UPI000C25F6C8|nr:hypothetical protein [Mycobacteroides abscessus]
MPVTKQRRLLGKRLAEATVLYMIERADPSSIGNTGLEGTDVEWEARRFPNAGLARRWCESFQPPRGEVFQAVIEVQRWVENNYTMPGYGVIRDAEAVTETKQLGDLLTTGWAWSQPESAPTW